MYTAFRTLVLLALVPTTTSAATFQYAAPVPTERGEHTAFLWIPPEADAVRGVIASGMTLMEREFVKDPVIRAACAEEGLALLFTTCGLRQTDLPALLKTFADTSGYRELPRAPLAFVGHSAGGPQAKERAVEHADRCFALVQYRGGAPGGGTPVPPGVPVLMMVGQFDEFGGTMRNEEGREQWEGAMGAMAGYRAADPANLGSVVVEPGAGHFAWSDRNAAYLALYVRKAARARIPDWPVDGAEPVVCVKVDPSSGWLTALDPRKADEGGGVAAYGEYQDEKSQAAWHVDRELAEATVAYHAGGFGKKDQFIKWDDPHWVDAGARFFFTNLKWVGDGQTFETHPVYRDQVPGQFNGHGPKWASAGDPVGHSGAPIRVRSCSGPVVAVGDHRLRMQYDNLDSAFGRQRVTFLAFSEGDDEYRTTEQVGMMPRGFSGLGKGEAQTITFPEVADVKADAGPVALKATSDSGLPVSYYVAVGPAEVVDGKLVIREVPKRAAFPIPVRVVAYQFGSGVEPLVKTAAPVERALRLLKP